MKYVCRGCRKLVGEADVIIQFRDGAGFAGGDTRAWCESCWENNK